MSVYKRRGSWFCDITIDGRRAQRVLKKARTRAQAIKAESVIQNKLFENKYKVEKRSEVRFDKFVKDHFLPYSELHKRTYPDDVLVCNMLFETFGRMNISEINPPMIEKFKQKRLEGETMYKRKRNPATVNRELCVLSKIFSLAFDAELNDSNPGSRADAAFPQAARANKSAFYNADGTPKSVREVYTWAVGQQNTQAPAAKDAPATAASALAAAKPAATNSRPIDIASLFPSMATPERVEIVASFGNADEPSIRREAPSAAPEAMVAAIQARSLPQPPVLPG